MDGGVVPETTEQSVGKHAVFQMKHHLGQWKKWKKLIFPGSHAVLDHLDETPGDAFSERSFG